MMVGSDYRVALAAFLVLGAAAGCSTGKVAAPQEAERPAEQRSAIMLGSLEPTPIDTSNTYAGAARLVFLAPDQTQGSLCTGTLVSCTDVLTAQHCLDEEPRGTPTQVFVTFNRYDKDGVAHPTKVVIDPLQDNVNFKRRR